MYKYFLLIIFILFFHSCNEKRTTIDSFSEKNIQYLVRDIEKIDIHLNIFSEDGFFRTDNNYIYYFDPIFANVYKIDTNGVIQKEYLGKGDGPNEIGQLFAWHTFDQQFNSIFLGRQSDIHIFDLDFKRIEDFMYTKFRNQEVYNNPRSYNEGMYNLDIIYGHNFLSSNTLTLTREKLLVVPLRILARVNPKLNTYTKGYFEQSNPLGLININTGKFEKTFGRWPEEYTDKILPNYDNKFSTTLNDTIFVSYNASHKIQAYTPYPELNLIYEFGVKESQMVNKYINFKPNVEQTDNSGYYSHIFGDEENNILFRSFINNKETNTGGVQIYRNKVLVGTISTEGKFNVIGKIGDYYYADGVLNEENQTLSIYKFKVQKND